MSKMPTVVVVESDARVVERVKELLADAAFRVVGVAGSTASGLALAEHARVDVVVVGSRVAGDVLALIRTLQRHGEVGKVVVLAPTADDNANADLVLAGAFGIVAIDDLDSLPICLRAVLRGEPAISRRLVGSLLEEYRKRDRALRRRLTGADRLTDREAEVLELLRRGHGTREIASLLNIAPVTVRTHIAAATRKLDVSSRAEAVDAVNLRVVPTSA